MVAPVPGMSLPIPLGGMSARTRLDFDVLMRHLMVVGFAALAAWTIASTTGLALGLTRISPHATLRFLLAVLVLVFARRAYWEVREWRWRRLPPDERFGFANPIREVPRSSERLADGDDGGAGLEGAPEARR
jgi:hypothetical protein